jgi:hypothetical protein
LTLLKASAMAEFLRKMHGRKRQYLRSPKKTFNETFNDFFNNRVGGVSVMG